MTRTNINHFAGSVEGRSRSHGISDKYIFTFFTSSKIPMLKKRQDPA